MDLIMDLITRLIINFENGSDNDNNNNNNSNNNNNNNNDNNNNNNKSLMTYINCALLGSCFCQLCFLQH